MLKFTSFSSDFLQENNELEMWQSLLHHYYFGHIQMPLTHIGKFSGNDSGDFPETFSKIDDFK